MVKIVTASANREFDEILDLLVMSLQITPAQFRDAENKYGAVSNWLHDDRSPLRPYFQEIYPQGSMRLDTTVRPLRHTEYDLDLVCQLRLRDMTPLEVYTMLLRRMEANGRYKDMIVPMPRCVRLNYSGQFHLDIIPSVQHPDCAPEDTCTKVPDREKRIWLPSNPKGYGNWFATMVKKQQPRKVARYHAEANVEPLRTPAPAYSKPVLTLAVQLLKRWRDVRFKDREALAPTSIVLTTLAGHLYQGEDHPTDALVTIVDGIHRWSQLERIRLRNPSYDQEWITDRWDKQPEAYDAFIEAIAELRATWHGLVENGRYPDMIDDLEDLFDKTPVTRAVAAFAERRGEALKSGTLLMEKATGILSTGPVQGALPVKGHTFHGP